jgi:hypothetical protein
MSELKLKLMGAFERLEHAGSEYPDQLLAVFQNFLNDIFLKIQKNVFTGN